MRYVLGLDAGGTKTSAVILDEARRECGRGAAGPGNYHSAGKVATLTALRNCIEEALGCAQLVPAQISAACFALSGVDRPEDRAVGESFARALLPGAQPIICNDAIAALYSGAGKAEGIVVIAGTGSIIYGYTPDGRKARASGWGYRLGDEGSGWWLAEQSLIAITRAYDGRGPETAMSASYLRELHLTQATDLITWAYSPAWTRDNVAALAPLTLESAKAGDKVALSLVQQGVEALAQAVQVVARKLQMHSAPFNVVLVGSLFRSALYEYAMRRALSEHTAHAKAILPSVDAAVGAAWIALDSLDGRGREWIA